MMSDRKITFEMRRRAVAAQSPKDLHREVMDGLARERSPWWRSGTATELPEFKSGLEVQVDITSCLSFGATGYVSYVFRNEAYLRDNAEFDDRMEISIPSDDAVYGRFVREAVPTFIRSFRPYRAVMNMDADRALEDWDESIELGRRTGRDEDGRDGMFRIRPVSFMDHEMCRRAFNLTPKECVARASKHIDFATELEDGCLLVATSRIVDGSKLSDIDALVRRALA
jgi:hypothetical protein